MFKKRIHNILVALFASAVLIGFALDQRFGGPFQVSQATLYLVAAIIWASTVVFRVIRCKSCGNRESNVG